METSVCADVALELLKHLLSASDNKILNAVHASKTFRSVNKTFRDAFDERKMGCTLLLNYCKAVMKTELLRIKLIHALLRHGPHTHVPRHAAAARWLKHRAVSSEYMSGESIMFINALIYIVKGVCGDRDTLHRSMLFMSPYTRKQLSQTRCLPKGVWRLSTPAFESPPSGTIEWTAGVTVAISRGRNMSWSYGFAQDVMKNMLQIEATQYNPAMPPQYIASVSAHHTKRSLSPQTMRDAYALYVEKLTASVR